MCAACVVVRRQSSSAAPWVEVGLCRGSFLALCEWRWLPELICSTGSCVSALVPSSFSQLRCGSQQEAEAGGGEQAAMGSLLALHLPPSLAFPAHRGLWLPQVPWLHAHVPPGSSRPGLSALRGSREVRALGPCRRSCGHQQSPALAGHWLYPACGSLSAGNYLFFGCRQKSKDFYCQAEWEELVTKGFLTLFTAFSRDQVGSQRRRVDVEASQAALM